MDNLGESVGRAPGGIKISGFDGAWEIPEATSWIRDRDGGLRVFNHYELIAEMAPGRWNLVRRLPETRVIN